MAEKQVMNEKQEKRIAKEQDKNYVDFRKAEILHDIKPKSKAVDLKRFDEAFPKPDKSKRKGGAMEFGETMHKYLLMRPDGRFATWPGKPVPKKKKAKAAADGKAGGLMHKMASAAGVAKQSKDSIPVTPKKQVKNYEKEVKKALIQQAEAEEDETDQKRQKEALTWLETAEVLAKTSHTLNAIVENKPFWLAGDPVVPEDETDAYVDADMLAEFVSGANRGKFPVNPSERTKFTPYGPVGPLHAMKEYQNKNLVIGNTLQSIIDSTADRKGVPKEREDKGVKPILKWCKKTKQLEYVMDSAPLEKTAIHEGKLQPIVKESGKKE
ncbi:hypothetical protein GCK72_001116 [Caenorhabditis remanei]|uniref:Uncharacterized protein n=2 Tax=Caenorhabditis remanei TaxID=31234 RepID=E3LXY6_CAERE|nr:hypothetical protein GCK72_001116 [Caenorhabditis remanei]EFO84719.1 hypothetical protein CRE_03735 [Caenorhabditis remanei]KAF1769299.1 hypothetical protein GCK72_001116 [Caenorhabditis remanei]